MGAVVIKTLTFGERTGAGWQTREVEILLLTIATPAPARAAQPWAITTREEPRADEDMRQRMAGAAYGKD